MSDNLRNCFKCNETKDIDEFYEGRYDCKDCRKEYKQEQDQVNWQKTMIHNARKKDKQYNRGYNEIDYIDIDYLNELVVNQHDKCIYCKCYMKYGLGENRNQPDGLSLQRIINHKIAHVKDNCVLCCTRCNKISQHISHELMLEFGKLFKNKVWKICNGPLHHGEIIKYFPYGYCSPCQIEVNQQNLKKRKTE